VAREARVKPRPATVAQVSAVRRTDLLDQHDYSVWAS
jgi:hypothetical protein